MMELIVGRYILLLLLLLLSLHHRIITINYAQLRRHVWTILGWLAGTLATVVITSLLS
jgi:hypothetical protein